MISVVKVFNTLRDLCNEDQRGFITPEVFNSFASLVQENVYEKMKEDLLNTVRLRKSNMDLGGIDSRHRELKEVMSDYIREEATNTPVSGSTFNKPHDLDRIISIHADTEKSEVRSSDSSYQCDIVYDLEKASMLMRSNLSSPTETFPLALIHDKIEILPDTISGISLMYYRRPTSIQGANTLDRNSSPSYALSSGGGIDVNLTRNFDLPAEYYDEVILEFAEMMGVRLRDPMIAGYSTQEQLQS
jgi:hypothetical protein